MKKKLLYVNVFICMMLILFQIIQSTVYAQQTNVDICVNGEKMSASNKTVQCGEGTAVYDEATQTLTLNNATITKYYGGTKAGIYTNTDLKIVLIGENVINNSVNDNLQIGITSIKKGVEISGYGSLKIEVPITGIQSTVSSVSIKDCELNIVSQVFGITAATQVSIIDTKKVTIHSGSPVQTNHLQGISVDIKNTEIEVKSLTNNGICSGKDINIYNCDVISHGKTQSMYSGSGNITINKSKIDAIGKESYGIYANNGNADITDSVIKVESGLNAIIAGDLSILSSEVNAKSTEDSAIVSQTNIEIDGHSKVKAEGKLYGILAVDSLTMSNAEIDAVSSLNTIAICSRKNITMNNAKIHAKGGTKSAAIATRRQKVSDEVASSKIDTGNLVEKNGGKVAFSDWFNFNANQRSWTSFVGKNDTGLNIVNNGMSNPLNEVSLATPYTITFDVNGGNGTNVEETVYYGDKVSVPTSTPTKNGAHFNGWHLNGTQFDFENTVITSDLTLKANFTTHIPNADDGDCTTPIKCSTCNTITTEAKTHNWTLECSKDNHWYKCQNAGCDSVKDKAAHTPGEEATKDHAQLCTVCGYEIESKLPDGTVIVDKATGVKAEYVDGTKFDMSNRLKVTRITPTRLNELNTVINKLEPKHSLAELYDVKLLMNGVEIQPSGKLKITIPMNEKMKSMSDLKVIYVDDNGNVTVIPSEVRNNTIIFITDHFSHYGVIGVEKTNPLTGDNMNIALLSTLLVSGFIIAFVNIKRKKMN